jgi:hypothetical protein
MLIGEPGARKSTSIKLAKRLLGATGYNTFAPSRTSKEKFLDDLQGDMDELLLYPTTTTKGKRDYDESTAANLWGDKTAGIEADAPKECFIVADEFNNFMAISDMEFHSILGELWDYEGIFRYRIRNGKSVSILNPTISILGGNTEENFARMFPPEIIGQGFLRRLILVYGEKIDDNRTTFPETPTSETIKELVKILQEIQLKIRDAAKISSEGLEMLDQIYQRWKDIPDVRLRSYSTSRFAQLIKLCLVIAASRLSRGIDDRIVKEANTYLSSVERLMPRALGEFGKGKYSDGAHNLLKVLNEATAPMEIKDIWKLLHKDFDKATDMAQVLRSLEDAEKIQRIPGRGFLPKLEKLQQTPHVDWSLLTEDERTLIGVMKS